MSKPRVTSPDPFREARRTRGVMQCPFNGENIVMLLRHEDVRSAAENYQQFSSDAPFRVPIPSEESVRTVRQLPIESDPIEHTDYREITQPFFMRAKNPEVIHDVKSMIRTVVTGLVGTESFDGISDLALPIQSRALTHLLNVPESEAERWIDWGIHVFKVTGGEFKTGNVLEDYLHQKFDDAESNPGADFFSELTQTTFRGRALTRDECMGFANLAFAGGRDTIIYTVASIIAYLGWKPESLEYLREDPRRITLASEEFFRVFMPLTQIGRVCPRGANIHGVEVQPDERVGLCWASANHDETVFNRPEEIQLDRRPNPHVSFGFRHHLCQGAAHSRLVVRALLEVLCEHVATVEIKEAVSNFEREQEYIREVGYESLTVSFLPHR